MTYFPLSESAYKTTNTYLIDSYNTRKAFGLTCRCFYALYVVHEKEFALAELVNFIIINYCIVANSFSGSESLEVRLKQVKAILVGENHLNDHHRFLFGHLARLIYSQGTCKLLLEGGQRYAIGTGELKYVAKAQAETHGNWEDGTLHSPIANSIQEGLKKILGASSSFLIARDSKNQSRAIANLESKLSRKLLIVDKKQKNHQANIYRKLLFLAEHILKMKTQHDEEVGEKIKAANWGRESQLANAIEREPVDVKVVTYSGSKHNKADSYTIDLLKQKKISFMSLLPKNCFETPLKEIQYLSQISDIDEARYKIKRFIVLDLNKELSRDGELLRRYAYWIDEVMQEEVKVLEALLCKELVRL